MQILGDMEKSELGENLDFFAKKDRVYLLIHPLRGEWQTAMKLLMAKQRGFHLPAMTEESIPMMTDKAAPINTNGVKPFIAAPAQKETGKEAEFVRRIYPAAQCLYETRNGLHPLFVTVQAASETGWKIKTASNNIFGVTKGESWMGPVNRLQTVEIFSTPDKKSVPPEKMISVERLRRIGTVFTFSLRLPLSVMLICMLLRFG